MRKSDELRQDKAQKVDELSALLDKAKSEKRGLISEERAAVDTLKTTINDLTERIDAEDLVEREQLRAAADEARRNETRRTAEKKTPEQKVSERYSILRAIRKAAEGKLDGIEAEMHQEAANEARAAGVDFSGNLHVPRMLRWDKRDMTAGTTTAGGFTVQTDVGQLIPFLDPRLVTRELGATYLTGLRGNIDFPRNDAAASAAWEGETDENSETSPTFDRVQISPNRLGAFTDISKQVLAQSSIDMEAFVRNRLNEAIARAVDTAAINGSGSGSEPTGILGTSGIGDVNIGANGGAPTWSHIIELETDVATANADMDRLAYLTTPGVRGILKQTEVASNTGMFVWNDGSGVAPGYGAMNGYRAFASTIVPSALTDGSGTGLHAVLFGNWAELIIAQWAGLDLVVDPYSGAKNALVTLVANTWWDIALRHAASFSAIQDADVTAGI